MKLKVIKIVFLTILVFTFKAYSQKLDILIKNGYVFDGLGNDSVRLDIGIVKDKIVFLGNSKIENIIADSTIDAEGCFVTPGFIDPHTHIENNLNSENAEKRAALIWLRQGVTTVITGNDGYGKTNTGEIFSKWEKNGIGLNVAMYIGLGPVRTSVLGNKNIQPTPDDLFKMQQLVKNAMEEGAIGLSTGLSYAPQNYATTSEIIAMAKVAAQYRGIYDTHMRAQGWPSSRNAIAEVLQIEKEAYLHVHISHIKVGPKSAFGHSKDIIDILDSARELGSTVDANVYPYLASSDALSGMLPRWAREKGYTQMLNFFTIPDSLEKILIHLRNDLKSIGGGINKQLVPRSEALAYLTGKKVSDIAALWNVPEEDAVIRLLKMQPNMGCLTFGIDEQDMLNFFKKKYIVIGSDGGETHPRGAGTFAKFIGEYCIKQHILSLKETIYKCTGLTAKIFNLKDRGVIKEGAFADIIVFDPKNYKANSSYQHPAELATGINTVLVNGVLTIRNDAYTGALSGKPIRYNNQ